MEKRKLLAVMKEIRKLAADISLTGMYRGSVKTLVKHYNNCLAIAKEEGLVNNKMFADPLPEDASADELGVTAALFIRYYLENDTSKEKHIHLYKTKRHHHCCDDDDEDDDDDDEDDDEDEDDEN